MALKQNRKVKERGGEIPLLDPVAATPPPGTRHVSEPSQDPQSLCGVRDRGTREAPLRGSSACPTVGVIARALLRSAARLGACDPSLPLGSHRAATCCAITLSLRTRSGPAPRGLPRPPVASRCSLRRATEGPGWARSRLPQAPPALLVRHVAPSGARRRPPALRAGTQRWRSLRSPSPPFTLSRRASGRASAPYGGSPARLRRTGSRLWGVPPPTPPCLAQDL
jgi:hypothetical protein